MFKQVKSALFWYYLYKFRKKVILISFLLIIVFFANAIYSDVVQYLTLKEKLEFLELALLSKWIIIIFNILLSIYLILTIFKVDKKENFNNNEDKKTKNNAIISDNKNSKTSNFTKREEEFLHKNIKSKADILVER